MPTSTPHEMAIDFFVMPFRRYRQLRTPAMRFAWERGVPYYSSSPVYDCHMRPALIAIAAAVGGVACHAAPIRTAASDSLPRGTPESALVVVRRGSELGYSGELAASGLERLAQLYDPTVRTLRIRSGGGSIGVGMDFGEWVHEHRLDVVVVDYCSSSCANYVFTAGVKKTIEPVKKTIDSTLFSSTRR